MIDLVKNLIPNHNLIFVSLVSIDWEEQKRVKWQICKKVNWTGRCGDTVPVNCARNSYKCVQQYATAVPPNVQGYL